MSILYNYRYLAMTNLDFMKISKYNIYVISKGDIYMKRFTKDELLQEIAAGNRTIDGLAAKFGLSTDSMQSALAKLEISLEEMEPEPLNNSPASVEDEWKQLYDDYEFDGIIGNLADFMIAECRIRYGMTAAQARQYMRDNFLSSNNRHKI